MLQMMSCTLLGTGRNEMLKLLPCLSETNNFILLPDLNRQIVFHSDTFYLNTVYCYILEQRGWV